jgi:hypothetical protein
MNLPPLSPTDVELVLQHLLSVRGMDVDDALDWLENHYNMDDHNESSTKHR